MTCPKSIGALCVGGARHGALARQALVGHPEDEICFFVFDAPSSREAALVAERAALDPIRVVEAVSSGKEQQ